MESIEPKITPPTLNNRSLMYQFVFFGILLILLSAVVIMQYNTTKIIQNQEHNIELNTNVGIGST